jgi:taurine dioxygenase
MSAIAPTVTAQPVAGHIGAEIEGVDLAAPLADATVEAIWAALTEHKVIFFRDQHLDDDTQVAFARRMGPLTTAHPTIPSVRDQAHVLDINAAHGGKANQWHTDVTFLDRPPAASILRAIELPAYGGDTTWANTAYAYATLPAPLRTLADGLWALHSNAFDYGAARSKPAASSGSDQRRYADLLGSTKYETKHPVVRVHSRSGERALLLGNFARRILGMSSSVSADLLRAFQDHITRLEHTVRWRWRPGDVAIWDNQATQHYAIADYDGPRSMHRVTLAGDVPVGVDGQRSEAITGDSSTYLAS